MENTSSYKQLESDIWFEAVNVPVELILGTFICFGNILVIAAFAQFNFLQTFNNYLVLNLAVADLLIGILIPAHIFLFILPLQNTKYLCLTVIFLISLSSGMSLLSLMAIAIERTIKVFFPLTYYNILTERRINGSLGCMWLTVITLTSPIYYLNNWNQEENVI